MMFLYFPTMSSGFQKKCGSFSVQFCIHIIHSLCMWTVSWALEVFYSGMNWSSGGKWRCMEMCWVPADCFCRAHQVIWRLKSEEVCSNRIIGLRCLFWVFLERIFMMLWEAKDYIKILALALFFLPSFRETSKVLLITVNAIFSFQKTSKNKRAEHS